MEAEYVTELLQSIQECEFFSTTSEAWGKEIKIATQLKAKEEHSVLEM